MEPSDRYICNDVPPTAVAQGSLAGYNTLGSMGKPRYCQNMSKAPQSPDEANAPIPSAAACMNISSYAYRSCGVGGGAMYASSGAPQLKLMKFAMELLTRYSTAMNRSSPASGDTASTMLAPGAMVWAYSISSAVS
jgi:hypothetical protein